MGPTSRSEHFEREKKFLALAGNGKSISWSLYQLSLHERRKRRHSQFNRYSVVSKVLSSKSRVVDIFRDFLL